ncbi:MAG TPA: hypothetical protein VNV37_12215 [Solirubrobacteraceae bacterium]|nr:hypothetical protein [Solirubrobacteraceae bacterium]
MSPATVTDIERFERVLLRRGVGALTADRSRCEDCGRTPLVGERVHLYEERGGIVCELCRPLRRTHPVATETVRHGPRGNCVLVATGMRAKGARLPASVDTGTRAGGACQPASAETGMLLETVVRAKGAHHPASVAHAA